MTGFEPQIFGVKSIPSTKYATYTLTAISIKIQLTNLAL